ncbi:hypothetical protein D3C86_1746500 [compost metagenome]
MRDYDADALVAGAPDHAIAGDHGRQVGAQVTAKHLAGQFAVLGFDFDLYAKMGDHQAELFRAEVAALEGLHGLRLALGRAGGAFALNFVDAPALPAVELAFGHESSEVDLR